MVSSIWIPEISAITSFDFFPRSSGGFGIQYWLQSRFIYPLVWRNTQIGKIFSFFWVLGQFSHHRLSKNRFISLFWPSFCLSTSKNRAKNLKTWKNTSIGVFRHTNHLPTRVLTGYWVPVRLELLGKNQNLLSPQTANLKWAKTRLLHRLPDLGFLEISPTLTDSISELKGS